MTEHNSPIDVRLQGSDVETQTLSAADARALLSDQRLRVLQSLHDEPAESVGALADRLDRSAPNVSTDIQLLSELGVVVTEDWDRNGKHLSTPFEEFSPSVSCGDSSNATTAISQSGLGTTSVDERRADWIRRPDGLDDREEISRGDVCWLPQGTGRGVALLALSHDLPDDCTQITGVVLTLDTTAADSRLRLERLDWSSGGPGLAADALSWAVHTVEKDDIEGVLGVVENDTCNDLSIRVQRFIGPARQ